MFIKSVEIINFRRFINRKIEFSNGLNIIIGANATGKTSIIEAIYTLCVSKSFRTADLKSLILFGKDSFFIKSKVYSSEMPEEITFYYDENGKVIKKNQNLYKRIIDYIGTINSVVFSSCDFDIITGSPKERRALFDLVICQISKDYLVTYNYYKNLIKEKNKLLKSLNYENNDKLFDLLDTINQQMLKYGSDIIKKRTEIVEVLNSILNEKHELLTNSDEKLKIIYHPNTSLNDYLFKINGYKQEEIKKSVSLIGPHRDNFTILINGLDSSLYASQGQQRNALISIKLAIAEVLTKKTGTRPVILLDDVFSELDKNRQNSLLRHLNSQYQTIITTSTISDIDQELVDAANIITIDERKE